MSGTIQAVAHDISKAFNKVRHACLLHNLKNQKLILPDNFMSNKTKSKDQHLYQIII